jgi:hypothetical protein
MEKHVDAGYMDLHAEHLGQDDPELAAQLSEIGQLEKRLSLVRKEWAGSGKRSKIKATDALAQVALVRKDRERLQAQLAVSARRADERVLLPRHAHTRLGL